MLILCRYQSHILFDWTLASSPEHELWKAPDENPGRDEEPHYSDDCYDKGPFGCALCLLPYSFCKSTVHPVNPCMNSSLALASQPFLFTTLLFRPGGRLPPDHLS